ncbi:MAG TPA: SUF system Fe-S cluster assembly regulator [Anaeromyxobacteraceae bacterium]|nr:SUF system Fe-S cluster assembly regulator [Anaeromyxobacteraceae bacterium]
MLRISKLTDYGLVLLTHLAQEAGRDVRTAQELAAGSKVPVPTVSKILKELSKAGIVLSHRGRHGGYCLARPPDQISVAAVVEALEGPVALTECSTLAGECSLEPDCLAKGHWGPISRAVQRTLQRLPLSALGPRPVRIGRPPAEQGSHLTEVIS